MSKGKAVAATLAAAALAVPAIVRWEGWERVAYKDPVGIITACAGATKGVTQRTYADAECEALLLRDVVDHAWRINTCLPADLPTETRAAFISAAYNIGTGAFCGSSMSRKALAGDLKGACASLSLWTKAGGRELRGLVNRRADERTLCERGLK